MLPDSRSRTRPTQKFRIMDPRSPPRRAQSGNGPTPLAEQARLGARAESYRRLGPGQIVTMEFNGGRLNIDVDTGERILQVRCG